MALGLKELGFTKEELQQRVVDQLCDRLTKSVSVDDEGGEHWCSSPLMKKLESAVHTRVDKAIEEIAAKHVLPNVANFLEVFCLQETTKWGEKIGDKLTFTEYLVARAEAYMGEKVNYEGKSKSEEGYNWNGTQTRVAHMIHKHLHCRIESAMKDALSKANNQIVKGLEETVKIKLNEISAGLSAVVKIK